MLYSYLPHLTLLQSFKMAFLKFIFIFNLFIDFQLPFYNRGTVRYCARSIIQYKLCGFNALYRVIQAKLKLI
ncbi:hypothetical protein PROVRETT_07308 [Providencia rettgeri DSM 1131]|nr:hypothetical protein PROVRETT_07308 [Providencia rettgeri DSM 1131]